MKITPLVMGSALVVILIVGIIIGVFNISEGNDLYEDQAYKQLSSVAESKAARVQYFLDNRKSDAIFLAGSEDVKNIFDEELVSDVGLMAAKIKSVTESTRDEVKDYLRVYPDMTIEELQNDEVFQSIAVQRVGDTGYTVIGDYESMITLFHRLPRQIGFDLTTFKETNPLIWGQMQDMLDYGEGYGFYEFADARGVVRDKYRYALKTNITTIDGGKLYVASTSFVDEYTGSIELASNLDSEFKLFRQKKGYEDLIFINPDGDVVWTAKQHNELGTNLRTGIYNDSLLANVYNKAKKDLGVGISDSGVYGPAGKLSIFVTAPVMEVNNVTGKRELGGIVALELDSEKISELIEADVGLGETGEVYIINRDGNHITALKFDNHTSSTSENIHSEGEEIIKSEGIENCFRNYNNYYFALQGEEFDEVPKTAKYFNYAEHSSVVLGAHQYILESGWCVIAEMDYNHFLKIAPRTNRDMAINMSVTLLLLLVTCLVLDSFFKVERKRK